MLKNPIRVNPGSVGFLTLEALNFRVPSVLDSYNQSGIITVNAISKLNNFVSMMNRYKKCDFTSPLMVYHFLTSLKRILNLESVSIFCPVLNRFIVYGTPNVFWPEERDMTYNENYLSNACYGGTEDNASQYLTEEQATNGNAFNQPSFAQSSGTDLWFNKCNFDQLRISIVPTEDIVFSGKLAKVFKLNPNKTTTWLAATAYTVEIANHGVSMLSVRCNVGRSQMSSVYNQGVVPSNVLTVVPCEKEQNVLMYYQNQGIGMRLPYNSTSIDELQLYFTDEWGDKITVNENEHMSFTAVLAFDIMLKEQKPAVKSLKRARETPEVTKMANTLKNVPYNRLS